MKVSEIALQIRDRIPVSSIRPADYVSTDNMRPNFGGIEVSSSLPLSGNVTAYQAGDILLSNIRPYFRKTWFATHNGGCNADVLCIRADPEKCIPQYLYYLLTTDNFVEDYLKSCKGAKMPRGNIQRLLDYEFNLPDLPTQLRIAAIIFNNRSEGCKADIVRIAHRSSISVNRFSISSTVGIMPLTVFGANLDNSYSKLETGCFQFPDGIT